VSEPNWEEIAENPNSVTWDEDQTKALQKLVVDYRRVVAENERLKSIGITKEVCEVRGGHCFGRTGMTLASSPPQHVEECKHCHAGRVAIPRHPFEYRDYER
jgi:hypothetical protein